MKVAVIGCAHGELDHIYESIKQVEERDGVKVDILLVCGDFQSVRNHADLKVMACPPKYRSLNTFYRYYSGEKIAPVLTVFIGGNHEASEYLLEIPHGGWVAPNIYYMGFANVVRYAGLRIAGLSGIYKRYSYSTGHYERAPLSQDDQRSVYHTREYDVLRMLQLQEPIDIMLSHDWPCGITRFGDENMLCRKKKHFTDEVAQNTLGSPPLWDFLQKKKPRYWFSAHLHVKFAALVPWEITGIDVKKRNRDLHTTRFLALDKVLPGRDYLQIADIPEIHAEPGASLEFDCEWLAVLRSTMSLWPREQRVPYGQFVPLVTGKHAPDANSINWIRERLLFVNHSLAIPTNFAQTAPPHGVHGQPSLKHGTNPQTYALMELLDDDPPAPRPVEAVKAVPERTKLSLPPPAAQPIVRTKLSLPPPITSTTQPPTRSKLSLPPPQNT